MNTKRIPLADRFWPKVIRGEGCWDWSGSKDSRGYGRLGLGGRRGRIIYASAASWMIHFGPIPDGLEVCHQCDNPPCSRPDHLFLATHRDNMRDSITKGRASKPPLLSGEKSRTAKLTWLTVARIRERHPVDGTAKLAAEYGVSLSAIKRIMNGRTWRA